MIHCSSHSATLCPISYVLLDALILEHAKWYPCHHGMARPQVQVGGDGCQILRVIASTLNTQEVVERTNRLHFFDTTRTA
jgi:hypothetical protein